MVDVTMIEFKYTAYRDMVQQFQQLGYELADYSQLNNDKMQLILRHDIDICCDRALQFAQFESQHNISSTYFFLVSSELYNLSSQRARHVVREVLTLGHRVGLHFDPSIYTGNIEQHADAECQFLESITGCPVEVISFHKPGNKALTTKSQFAGRINAYAEEFFTHMGYCSDSKGLWRFGDPLSQAAVAEKRSLQLVTHPIWWASDLPTTASPEQKLEAFIVARANFLAKELGEQCAPFANWHQQCRLQATASSSTAVSATAGSL